MCIIHLYISKRRPKNFFVVVIYRHVFRLIIYFFFQKFNKSYFSSLQSFLYNIYNRLYYFIVLSIEALFFVVCCVKISKISLSLSLLPKKLFLWYILKKEREILISFYANSAEPSRFILKSKSIIKMVRPTRILSFLSLSLFLI